MRTRRLPSLLVWLLIVPTAAACVGGDGGDGTLTPRLIDPPFAGGPWVSGSERGNPIDVLEPACGVALPESRPLSIGHTGQVFLTGDTYPVIIQIVDRFESPSDAEAIVSLHREAATRCDTWALDDPDGPVTFTLSALDVGPDDAVALEVIAESEGVQIVTRQIMIADGEVIEFLAHIGEGPLDPGVFTELVAAATADGG